MHVASQVISTSGSRERRVHAREQVVAPTVVRPDSEVAAIEVETRDLSTSGCMFISDEPVAVGARIIVGLAGAGRVHAIVVRSAGSAHACVFESPLTIAERRSAFTGTAIIQLAENPQPGISTTDDRLPRRSRYLVLFLLALAAWGIPGLAWVALT